LVLITIVKAKNKTGNKCFFILRFFCYERLPNAKIRKIVGFIGFQAEMFSTQMLTKKQLRCATAFSMNIQNTLSD